MLTGIYLGCTHLCVIVCACMCACVCLHMCACVCVLVRICVGVCVCKSVLGEAFHLVFLLCQTSLEISSQLKVSEKNSGGV